MDISEYNIEDLLTSAIKSEAEAREVYSNISRNVKNAFLKERMDFLASEEKKHKEFLEKLWHKKFPGVGVALPETSPVPMPAMKDWDENIPVSEVLTSAMAAETAASEFYAALAERFEDKESKDLLNYLSKMEKGHYRILEVERSNAEEFEDYDSMWPMMHAGP